MKRFVSIKGLNPSIFNSYWCLLTLFFSIAAFGRVSEFWVWNELLKPTSATPALIDRSSISVHDSLFSGNSLSALDALLDLGPFEVELGFSRIEFPWDRTEGEVPASWLARQNSLSAGLGRYFVSRRALYGRFAIALHSFFPETYTSLRMESGHVDRDFRSRFFVATLFGISESLSNLRIGAEFTRRAWGESHVGLTSAALLFMSDKRTTASLPRETLLMGLGPVLEWRGSFLDLKLEVPWHLRTLREPDLTSTNQFSATPDFYANIRIPLPL